MIKLNPFNPFMPIATKLRAFRRKTPRREIKCLHKNVKTSHSPGCVIEHFCADCGEWLGDKDVS